MLPAQRRASLNAAIAAALLAKATLPLRLSRFARRFHRHMRRKVLRPAHPTILIITARNARLWSPLQAAPRYSPCFPRLTCGGFGGRAPEALVPLFLRRVASSADMRNDRMQATMGREDPPPPLTEPATPERPLC